VLKANTNRTLMHPLAPKCTLTAIVSELPTRAIKPVRNGWFSYAFWGVFAGFGVESCKNE